MLLDTFIMLYLQLYSIGRTMCILIYDIVIIKFRQTSIPFLSVNTTVEQFIIDSSSLETFKNKLVLEFTSYRVMDNNNNNNNNVTPRMPVFHIFTNDLPKMGQSVSTWLCAHNH